MTAWSVTTPIIARELAAVHGRVPVPGFGFRVPGFGIRITGFLFTATQKGPDLGSGRRRIGKLCYTAAQKHEGRNSFRAIFQGRGYSGDCGHICTSCPERDGVI
jgi:hypothetical protein